MAARVVPELPPPNGRVRLTRWGENPLAQGAYISFRAGQLTRFGGLLTVEEQGSAHARLDGPLLFAGEWLRDAWPGYMNGAAQTGRITAAAAVRAEVAAGVCSSTEHGCGADMTRDGYAISRNI